MEFGIQLGGLEPAQFRAHAQTAEALGYDLIVFPDHLVNEGPDRQLDVKSKAFDHVAMAAVVMEATKKIRVGHLVLCNLFRHPSITAQSLMTLDHISGGRLVAGLGSGWTETEFKMSGIQFPPITERLRMLDESIACILSLWKNERTTFDGEFYHLKDAILWPKPIQQPHPPIILGGGGKGLLRLAAKYADYINVIPEAGKRGHISMEVVKRTNDKSFREKVSFVRDEAKRLGRKPDAVKVSNFVFATILSESREASR
ncbi:MAG: LLM class flavin-dependent oxidoreductase, partial [Candidatus Binatus sp.]